MQLIRIDNESLNAWRQGDLTSAVAILSRTVQDGDHHRLANLALVRARLKEWGVAEQHARASIQAQPTILAHIALSVALGGKGELAAAKQEFNRVFLRSEPKSECLLLLIKSIIIFVAGDDDEAVRRVTDLVQACVEVDKALCRVIQAQMQLLVGQTAMYERDYEKALKSFASAGALAPFSKLPELETISLMFGWDFNSLLLAIRQRTCEAQYAASQMSKAVESLRAMLNEFEAEIKASVELSDWLENFTRGCVKALETAADTVAAAGNYGEAIAHYSVALSLNPPSRGDLVAKRNKVRLAIGAWDDAMKDLDEAGSSRFTIYTQIGEALLGAGRVTDAIEILHRLKRDLGEDETVSGASGDWVTDFTQRCLSAPDSNVEAASKAGQHDEAPTPHATLNSLTRIPLLREWVRVILARGPWKDALVTAANFTLPRFTVYQTICERLEIIGRITDASECFRQMMVELAEQTTTEDERAEWVLDFKRRCSGKLEDLGDTAMNAEQHDDAIIQYSAALSLDPASPDGLVIKRSKAYVAGGLWESALNDANKVIVLDPSSPWGYERKHAALHKAGDYGNAIDAFEAMLSKMSQSPDLEIRERHHEYVTPAQTKATIRRTVQDVIRDSPRVLINTISGHLCSKTQQFAVFESLPVFKELISSMTTHIDYARIKRDITEYYRYATFSHIWEDDEPLFEKVTHIVVYDLEESLTHDKLQMFCRIVRDAGFNWAWYDTCCINKADHIVLQEALVAMFKWYEGSALTIVFLRGVRSPSRRGDLVRSIWNSRAWSFQEYHASKVVRFYTEDWRPYLDLDIPNHKESPEILSEMEEATGVSTRALMALRPGLDDIREKLRLASQRQTSLVEDEAYSLLGIFSISLPVVYGEGDKALGRLLAQLLTSSGDTSILAWTGKSGNFNSCLPANITVFNELSTTHIPPAIHGAELDTITAGTSLNPTLVMKLYDRLLELPVPFFTGQQMKLPCLTFKLGPVSASRTRSGQAFRAETAVLGIVEIRTNENLSRLDSLYLIHPWIDFLLGRQPVGSAIETLPEESEGSDDQSSSIGALLSSSGPSNITPAPKQSRASRLAARLGRPFSGRPAAPLLDPSSLRSPSTVSQANKQMQALQVLARLRQPFGALLLTPNLGSVAAYRRVATESLITVQVVEEITPTILNKLIDGIRILDVL